MGLGRSDRSDLPVSLERSSAKIKVLGILMGPGNLDEDNRRPRITAVANTLFSWRQRILSFQGRALVINALALSRVWYVASLVHMPPWVKWRIGAARFGLFWKGKKDLVARAVVVQAPLVGFFVADVKLKVQSLLVQWVRRFTLTSSCWSALLVLWFYSVFNSTPLRSFLVLLLSAPLLYLLFTSLCFWPGVQLTVPSRVLGLRW